jgi:hypothetical protein
MNFSTSIIVIWICVFLVGLCGWISNIFTIAHSDFAHVTGLLVLRVIGVFIPPLGAVLGFV